MDLNTDLPGPPGITGRTSGRICCDPALGFADQRGNIGQHSAFGWRGAYGGGEPHTFEVATGTAEMAENARDEYFEGCLKIQDDERLRLGRELHDSTGQLLLALRLNVAQLKRIHGTTGADDLLDEIEETASQIDREIRSFAFLHYPAELGRCGLCDSLDTLVRGLAARTGLRIRFVRRCDFVESGPAGTALLRVAQEALLNVYRHAHAVHVRVSLTRRERRLELVVRDDGVGIPSAEEIWNSHGVGLLGMRHRVERLGGRFALKRMKQGTKLTASVPLPDRSAVTPE